MILEETQPLRQVTAIVDHRDGTGTVSTWQDVPDHLFTKLLEEFGTPHEQHIVSMTYDDAGNSITKVHTGFDE